jgi:hypothetical protein
MNEPDSGAGYEPILLAHDPGRYLIDSKEMMIVSENDTLG